MACSKIGHTCGCSGGCSGCSGTCTCSGGCSCGSGCTCGSNCSGTCSSTCSGGCKATCADSCENTCTSACKNFKRYSGGSWIGVSEMSRGVEMPHKDGGIDVLVQPHYQTLDGGGRRPAHIKTMERVFICAVACFVYSTNYNPGPGYNWSIDNHTGMPISKINNVKKIYNTNGNCDLHNAFMSSPEGYTKYFDSSGYVNRSAYGRLEGFCTDGLWFKSSHTVTQVKAYKNGSWVGLGYKE